MLAMVEPEEVEGSGACIVQVYVITPWAQPPLLNHSNYSSTTFRKGLQKF